MKTYSVKIFDTDNKEIFRFEIDRVLVEEEERTVEEKVDYIIASFPRHLAEDLD